MDRTKAAIRVGFRAAASTREYSTPTWNRIFLATGG